MPGPPSLPLATCAAPLGREGGGQMMASYLLPTLGNLASPAGADLATLPWVWGQGPQAR